MATVDKIITAYSSRQIYLERLNATLGNEFLPFIERVKGRVSAIVSNLPKRNPMAAMDSILQEIDTIVKEELREACSELKKSQREIGKSEITFCEKVLGSVIDSSIVLNTPAISQIITAVNETPIQVGKNDYTTYQRMFRQYVNDQAQRIDGIVRNGFINGQTNQRIAEIILDDLDPWEKGADSKARTLARTGTNHYSTQSRLQLQEDNEDIIIGWRSVATLDSRTSEVCRSLDGIVMKESDPRFGQFQPPRHPNCRTAIAPEIDGRYSYDTSNSKRPSNFTVDGKKDFERIDSKKTYYQEMKKLSAKDQDLILGPTLGKAFRKLDDPEAFAKYTIDSKTLRPLTIAQIETKQNALAKILKAT